MLLTLCLNLVAAQPVAVVFGKELSRKDLVPASELAAQRKALPPEQVTTWLEGAQCDALQGLVWEAVFADYVKAKSLEPTKQEIDACARAHRAHRLKTWTPGDGPAPALDRAWAGMMLGWWKRDVALYREYGGRLIFQQHGLEPIDAWRKLLEDHEARGSFVVSDPKLKGCVYAYFSLKFFGGGEEATKKFLERSPCTGWQ